MPGGARSRSCACLRRRYPERPTWHLAPETIYQALYDPSVPLERTAGQCLRTRRPRRRPRRNPHGRTARPARMRPLQDRPAGAADRSEAGHWESQCRCQAVMGRAGSGST